MIYTALCVMFLMRADPLRGQEGGGWALEIKSFLGPVKWHRADRRVPFGAQKTWGKNQLKDTTAYIVQQSRGRWHCEPTCLLGLLGLNKEKFLHTLPLQSLFYRFGPPVSNLIYQFFLPTALKFMEKETSQPSIGSL
jgi:hypothetical protein